MNSFNTVIHYANFKRSALYARRRGTQLAPLYTDLYNTASPFMVRDVPRTPTPTSVCAMDWEALAAESALHCDETLCEQLLREMMEADASGGTVSEMDTPANMEL
jgi:hypothetical protein